DLCLAYGLPEGQRLPPRNRRSELDPVVIRDPERRGADGGKPPLRFERREQRPRRGDPAIERRPCARIGMTVDSRETEPVAVKVARSDRNLGASEIEAQGGLRARHVAAFPSDSDGVV